MSQSSASQLKIQTNPTRTDARESPPEYDARDSSLAQSGLPVEILQNIFTNIPSSVVHRRDDFPAQLVPIHVCRAWRSAALSCADIWIGPIPLNNTAITTLALERAYRWQEMLIINAPPGSYVDPRALSTSLERPSRIEELTCPIMREMNAAFMREATRLRSLNIWQEFQCIDYTDERSDVPYGDYREADAFGGLEALRRLRELRLHGDDMRTTPAVLMNLPLLTALELTLPHELWLSLDDLYTALRAMPLLKTLALRGAVIPRGSSPDPGPPFPETMVPLNRLERINLKGSYNVLSSIFNYLSIPRCTRVSLTIRIDDGGLQHVVWPDFEHFPSLDERLVELFGPRLEDNYPLQHLSLRVYDRGNQVNDIWRYPTNATDLLGHLHYHLRTLDLRFGMAAQPGIRADGDTVFLPKLTHLHISAPPYLLGLVSAAIQTPPTTYRSFALQMGHSDQFSLVSADALELVTLSLGLQVPHPTQDHTACMSYTRLDITPARDNPTGCLRVVASGRTGVHANILPPIVDVAFEEPGMLIPYRSYRNAVPPFLHGLRLGSLLGALPLGALDVVHIADGLDSIYWDPPLKSGTAFENLSVLQRLKHARLVDISFYVSAVGPFLKAAHEFERLEHISLRSMTIGDELAELKLWPRLYTTAKAPRILVSVANCAITERDARALQSWAGPDNFDWDGREVVDCAPSWGAGDSPWRAPEAREVRFWRPELWENELCTLDDMSSQM
ncbi:hypothetical protein PENSPDRAFT_748909 [Peniophora sp. CONT]|nr:hypothetical protein PENSPDRAFT_748909 [Peniophora sp. CONT]